MIVRLGLAAALSIVLAACAGDAPTALHESGTGGQAPTYARGTAPDQDLQDRYIVVLKDDVDSPDDVTDEIVRGSGIAHVHARWHNALKGFSATIPEQALHGIRNNPHVDFVEADGIVTASGTQANPPSWGLDRIDQRPLPLDLTHNYPNDGSDVTVYIIDTGMRLDHTEYAGRAVSGYDYIDNDNDATDCHGHGTHVAGTVGGTTVGVAKNVNLVAVRVLDCAGSGTYTQVISGVDWVTANHSGPSVANMSLGGGYDAALNLAVSNSIASGVVYAVAAGNDGQLACNYSPASTADAITVGATGSNDARASFSNYGSCVDIFAPGVGITSSTRSTTSSYESWSGTSMASPHVAGVAALYLYDHPTATPTQVANAIINDATLNLLTSIGTGSPNRLLHNFWVDPNAPTAPNAPTNLTATATSTSAISLAWTDNASNETNVSVERATSSTGPFTQIALLGANAVSYSSTGLAEGTAYWYRVEATNAGGTSGYSNVASATTRRRVHVDGLAVGSTSVSGGWTGRLTVTVKSAAGVAQSGVSVTVSWGTGSATAVTGTNGQCTITSAKQKNSTRSLLMTVTNVAGTGFVYDSAANNPNPARLTANKP
jgi:subtilisin family serine protease